MKTKKMRNVMVALISVAVIAVGANAMAGKGTGDGEDNRGYGGYGQHHRRGDCPYGQGFSNLTAEQREQMETERQAYFEATRQDRQDLYAKRLALKAEIAKSEPDMKTASAIQQEVSAMQAELDQKRLEHIMAMRKINPDAGRGFFMEGRGHGRHGMGGGRGQGMGYGPGHCRD